MWTMWSQVTKHFTRGAASISGRDKMHEVCRERARNRTKVYVVRFPICSEVDR